MRSRTKRVLAACFVFHFLLIGFISCRETLWLVRSGLTVVPVSRGPFWNRADQIAANLRLERKNPIKEAFVSYVTLAGIDRGYGYFAPNVPGSCKVIFEVHHASGRVETELPRVRSEAAGLRLSSLLDQLGHEEYAPLRELVLRMLAYSIWREESDVTMIRAELNALVLPDAAEYAEGRREIMQPLGAFEFQMRDPAPADTPNK